VKQSSSIRSYSCIVMLPQSGGRTLIPYCMLVWKKLKIQALLPTSYVTQLSDQVEGSHDSNAVSR